MPNRNGYRSSMSAIMAPPARVRRLTLPPSALRSKLLRAPAAAGALSYWNIPDRNLEVLSNVQLELMAGAVILGSRNVADYEVHSSRQRKITEDSQCLHTHCRAAHSWPFLRCCHGHGRHERLQVFRSASSCIPCAT